MSARHSAQLPPCTLVGHIITSETIPENKFVERHAPGSVDISQALQEGYQRNIDIDQKKYPNYVRAIFIFKKVFPNQGATRRITFVSTDTGL